VDPGQTEAALSQGMTRWQALRLVLLPQAFRRMLPPLTGEFVSLVKDSSLLSVVGVVEITKASRDFAAETYRTYEIFLPLAVTYLAITFPLSRLARRLELRSAGP
jgi:polar amino acid transport system permease protein